MRKQINTKVSTWLALGLLPLSGLATDVYIPSMPAMANDLHASNLQIQLTLGIFIISYGITQLFIGSLLDSYGRYPFSLVSLLVFMASNVFIASSETVEFIYAMRILQGISVAIIVVSKRAYFIDVFSGNRLAHYLSMFTIIWSAGPIFAPFIGGFLEERFSWRANFYFLAIYAVIVILLEVIYGGETIRSRSKFNFSNILNTYRGMLMTTDFTSGISMLCFAYSMIMVYNLTGAFILERAFSQSPVVIGKCSLILGIAWLTGGLLGRATIKVSFLKKMMANTGLQFLLSFLMMAIIFYSANLLVMMGFAFLIHAAAGYTYNNYFGYCLSRFPSNAGIAGGLTGGVVNMIMFLITFFIVSYLPAPTAQSLSFAYLVLSSCSLILFIFIRRGKQSKNQLNLKA